ncbi:MAG: helix-turn-helix domain-containing protein [Proteobacteria bacterium]|nr:helix-turn-helix domain-containing protein [Pseudomonadota bacterium]MCP4921022.1 helix-turn-helix domain-containing protein [Pseudomonadota bacterium]
MASFYDRLGVPNGASEEAVREGYQRSLARLVKKLRDTRSRGGDTQVLEAERDAVREAFDVLTDTTRRRRYDLLLQTEAQGLPQAPEDLWDTVQEGLVDPTAAAAVEVVRELTELDVGGSFTDAAYEKTAPAAPPQPPAVSMLSPAERDERARAASEPVPEPPNLTAFELPPPRISQPVEFEVAEPAMPDVARHVGHDGRYIASVRASKGMTVDDLSSSTRIAARYIEAIENNDFERLPAAVFVRGYLREIAQVLDVDEAALVEGYMALYTHARG